ncbi:prepilin-type N-terminal cleavage/methylation domain-containing protein [Candidatus Parcubacteria bacterium]|nr:prepilin-type N-terminal cleavage/methylation domain-containing protein [Candidatus Parcubacteria bacterium]
MPFSFKKNRGFTLVESVVGVAVFMMVVAALYQSYLGLLSLVSLSRYRIAAADLATEQFEIARNLPYEDVGIIGGVPEGVLTQSQSLVRDGFTFSVVTTVRAIDNPFDGAVGETPSDSSPSDYKQVEVEIACVACRNTTPVTYSTYVAPKNLESASAGGALTVTVFNASGIAVPGARVQILNASTTKPISIDDVTNNQGKLTVYDLPPGTTEYRIIVSKNGYSQEQTYAPGGSPANPTNLNATIVLGSLTSKSFSIDRLGTLALSSRTNTCAPVPNIAYTLTGTKLIGTNPNVPKYQANRNTGSSGTYTDFLEWDTYTLTETDEDNDIAGTIPPLPLSVVPGGNQNFSLVLAPSSANKLLVTVLDQSSGLSLSDAEVTLSRVGYTRTLTTDLGAVLQSDWVQGGGQATSSGLSSTRFSSTNGNINTSVAGQVTLAQVLGTYQASGELTSSVFDTGAASNFTEIQWNPATQSPVVGANSVRFQVATNNDGGAWVFRGPDGTSATYYTSSGASLNSVHNGQRYLRYKMFLSTAVATATPTVADVSLSFTSSCLPPGQVFFDGLSTGDYTLTVTRAGYQSVDIPLTISGGAQYSTVTLSP